MHRTPVVLLMALFGFSPIGPALSVLVRTRTRLRPAVNGGQPCWCCSDAPKPLVGETSLWRSFRCGCMLRPRRYAPAKLGPAGDTALRVFPCLRARRNLVRCIPGQLPISVLNARRRVFHLLTHTSGFRNTRKVVHNNLQLFLAARYPFGLWRIAGFRRQ